MQGKEENNLLSLVLQIVMYEVRREGRSRRSGSRDGRRGSRPGKRGNRERQNKYLFRFSHLSLSHSDPTSRPWYADGGVPAKILLVREDEVSAATVGRSDDPPFITLRPPTPLQPGVSSGSPGPMAFPPFRKTHWLVFYSISYSSLSLLLDSLAWCRFAISSKR